MGVETHKSIICYHVTYLTQSKDVWKKVYSVFWLLVAIMNGESVQYKCNSCFRYVGSLSLGPLMFGNWCKLSHTLTCLNCPKERLLVYVCTEQHLTFIFTVWLDQLCVQLCMRAYLSGTFIVGTMPLKICDICAHVKTILNHPGRLYVVHCETTLECNLVRVGKWL